MLPGPQATSSSLCGWLRAVSIWSPSTAGFPPGSRGATFQISSGAQSRATTGDFGARTCLIKAWHPSSRLATRFADTVTSYHTRQRFVNSRAWVPGSLSIHWGYRIKSLKGTSWGLTPSCCRSAQRESNLAKITEQVCRGAGPRNQVSWSPVEGVVSSWCSK